MDIDNPKTQSQLNLNLKLKTLKQLMTLNPKQLKTHQENQTGHDEMQMQQQDFKENGQSLSSQQSP